MRVPVSQSTTAIRSDVRFIECCCRDVREAAWRTCSCTTPTWLLRQRSTGQVPTALLKPIHVQTSLCGVQRFFNAALITAQRQHPDHPVFCYSGVKVTTAETRRWLTSSTCRWTVTCENCCRHRTAARWTTAAFPETSVSSASPTAQCNKQHVVLLDSPLYSLRRGLQSAWANKELELGNILHLVE